MRVREVDDAEERVRLWDLSVAAFPPYADYQQKTARAIPLFVAEPAVERPLPALVAPVETGTQGWGLSYEIHPR